MFPLASSSGASMSDGVATRARANTPLVLELLLRLSDEWLPTGQEIIPPWRCSRRCYAVGIGYRAYNPRGRYPRCRSSRSGSSTS
ncbi:UNVERIFIED_CONTAM: hypothetical protein Slati_4025300 [Sesamum latifolium]|uniref:Uncharacterized protein n=1 Tax=Sesamum latifolium TaxID=2727402 RepID=A0AAW2TRK4_9LAMI